MNRDEAIERLAARRTPWDMVVIGGGATGLGIALDAATRGYETLLLERDDFAQATSSRSTKLLHGGVRYLRQGNLKLVMGALRERGRVLANAPHLASEQPFVIPTYRRGESLYYGFGLGVYERLAGRASLGRSRRLDAAETRRELPGLRADGLRGGVLYHDGQFDDARLAVCLAASAWDHGATPVNYCQVTGLLRAGGAGTPVAGVVARDRETGAEYEIPRARGGQRHRGVLRFDPSHGRTRGRRAGGAEPGRAHRARPALSARPQRDHGAEDRRRPGAVRRFPGRTGCWSAPPTRRSRTPRPNRARSRRRSISCSNTPGATCRKRRAGRTC